MSLNKMELLEGLHSDLLSQLKKEIKEDCVPPYFGNYKEAVIEQWNMLQKGFSATQENPIPEYVFEAVAAYYYRKLINGILRAKKEAITSYSRQDFVNTICKRISKEAAVLVVYAINTSERIKDLASMSNLLGDLSRMPNYNPPNEPSPMDWIPAVSAVSFLYGLKLASTGELLSTELHIELLKQEGYSGSFAKFGISAIGRNREYDYYFT